MESEQDAVPFSVSRQDVFVCVLLVVATFGVYLPVLRYPFVNYDDNVYITANRYVNMGLNWQNFNWAWTTMAAGNWHPVTWLSHQFDWQMFGAYAGGHHLTSLLFHLVNAALLFWLLRRGTGALWRSATVAALFALHPLDVESVAWTAERTISGAPDWATAPKWPEGRPIAQWPRLAAGRRDNLSSTG
jgi:hypothetical protein